MKTAPRIWQVSRATAEALIPGPRDTVVVSITDSRDAELHPGWTDVIRLRFYDIAEPIRSSPQYNPITAPQATLIARFVKKHRGKDIVVHCEAGISRSGAIVTVILEAFPEYIDSGTYNAYINARRPNPRVKEFVLAALRRKG